MLSIHRDAALSERFVSVALGFSNDFSEASGSSLRVEANGGKADKEAKWPEGAKWAKEQGGRRGQGGWREQQNRHLPQCLALHRRRDRVGSFGKVHASLDRVSQDRRCCRVTRFFLFQLRQKNQVMSMQSYKKKTLSEALPHLHVIFRNTYINHPLAHNVPDNVVRCVCFHRCFIRVGRADPKACIEQGRSQFYHRQRMRTENLRLGAELNWFATSMNCPRGIREKAKVKKA